MSFSEQTTMLVSSVANIFTTLKEKIDLLSKNQDNTIALMQSRVWEPSIALPSSSGWHKLVVTGTGRIVAIASSGTVRLAYTDDFGRSWTNVSIPSQNWRDIDVNGTNLIAVSDDGTNRVIRSTDNGESWSEVSVPSSEWNVIRYAKHLNRWIALSKSGSAVCMTSGDNGSSWSSRTATSGTWTSLAIGDAGDIIVAGAVTGSNRLMTTWDGITWTNVTPESFFYPRCTTWCSWLDKYIGIGGGNTNPVTIMTSNNGESWEVNTITNLYTQFRDIKSIDSLKCLMIVGQSVDGGSTLMMSYDGEYWIERPFFDSNNWTSIIHSDKYERMMVVSPDSSNATFRSF